MKSFYVSVRRKIKAKTIVQDLLVDVDGSVVDTRRSMSEQVNK